jgi:hypothetical protein
MGTYCAPIRHTDWHEPVENPWRKAEEREDDYQLVLELVHRSFRAGSAEHDAQLLGGTGTGTGTVEATGSLVLRFREQADKWDRETRHLSSPTQRIMHPSYQAILGMGQEHREEVIRLLILDMQQHRRAWFWALSYLTQDNPISPADSGKMDKMIKAWVKWGGRKGIL